MSLSEKFPGFKRLNDSCAVAMQPRVKLRWPIVFVFIESTCENAILACARFTEQWKTRCKLAVFRFTGGRADLAEATEAIAPGTCRKEAPRRVVCNIGDDFSFFLPKVKDELTPLLHFPYSPLPFSPFRSIGPQIHLGSLGERPTRHNIGHFGGGLHSQSLD